MKVIFLDIDGVLNSRAYDRTRNWDAQTEIDETRLPLLKGIVDKTGAKIVLSSTWRMHWNADPEKCDEDGKYINSTFAKYGLEIADKTPNLGLTALRRDEVKIWLLYAGSAVESYVIIDDYRYGWGELADKLVLTNPNFGRGLEEKHVFKAIEILQVDCGG